MTTTTVTLSPHAKGYLAHIGSGANVLHVEWTGTAVKPAAAHKERVLTKTVSATVLTGVEYPKLAVNDGATTGSLPWGEWVAYPHIITHKGVEYARLYTVHGTVKAAYFVDGIKVDRAVFESYLTPSARGTKRPHGGTLTVKLANLRVLGTAL